MQIPPPIYPPAMPPVDLLFKELMEADEIIRPMLVATWYREHPLLVERVYRMWDEYCAIGSEDGKAAQGRKLKHSERG